MSISCFEMRLSSKSKGPEKLLRATLKPASVG
jgi:hypothetical protein